MRQTFSVALDGDIAAGDLAAGDLAAGDLAGIAATDRARPEEQARAEKAAAAMWAGDAASQAMGMSLDEIRPGYARMTMRVRDDMVNGHGVSHGGFVFALADSAFAFACNSYNRTTLAQACDITFISPVRTGDVLVAEAVERARYGRNGIYDVTVRCGGATVAEFRGRSRQVAGTLAPE
jgi:phenylacetic acid degradation protein PaaD